MKRDVRPFVRTVIAYWKKEGRHDLPWRITSEPYAILVSEIMLQQTQVDRVIPYFSRWLARFPTVQSLSRARLPSVLRTWSGLGYNRRAKLLRDCAREIHTQHAGVLPRNRTELESLPGIGPYTAGAIRAFAYDEKEVFIETNIRAALIHHFFPRSKKVDDAKLIPILEECVRTIDSARMWYSALMDYGAHIKKTNPNPSRRSAHHVRQAPFEGSLRKVRGALLRKLLTGPITEAALLAVEVKESYQIERALRDLAHEGLVKKRGNTWWIA